MARLPTLEQLAERLVSPGTKGIGLRDEVFRSAPPQYADSKLLIDGGGAKRTGGRWNPRGVAALYCALTPEAALAEALAYARYMGWPVSRGFPRVIVALRVKLSNVLDLTDRSIRRRLGVSAERMTTTDWRKEVAGGRIPLTHLIGRAAFDVGLEGLLVASASGKAAPNIVIYPVNLLRSSTVKILKGRK
jgi:RES domain-containing protein